MPGPKRGKRSPRRGGNALLDDPYLYQIDYKEPTICPNCHAVYKNKRWYFDEKVLEDVRISRKYNSKKCPACRKIDDHYVMGVLEAVGHFVKEHYEEIVRRIRNEEKRALRTNPLERILETKKNKDGLTVHTISDNLAVRLGKALFKSYKGKLEIKFSENEKIVRVYWVRED